MGAAWARVMLVTLGMEKLFSGTTSVFRLAPAGFIGSDIPPSLD